MRHELGVVVHRSPARHHDGPVSRRHRRCLPPTTPPTGHRPGNRRGHRRPDPLRLDPRNAIADQYKALVTVGAGTGMRRGELLGLTWDRVDFAGRTILVDRQIDRRATAEAPAWAQTKTEASERVIPVADGVLDAITAHGDEYGLHKTGLIFTTTIGSALRPGTLHRAWSLAAVGVGKDVTPHDLRHYFASEHLRAGTSIKALQKYLGHKSATETLDTYGHLMGDESDHARHVIQTALFSDPADSLRAATTAEMRLRRSEA